MVIQPYSLFCYTVYPSKQHWVVRHIQQLEAQGFKHIISIEWVGNESPYQCIEPPCWLNAAGDQKSIIFSNGASQSYFLHCCTELYTWCTSSNKDGIGGSARQFDVASKQAAPNSKKQCREAIPCFISVPQKIKNKKLAYLLNFYTPGIYEQNTCKAKVARYPPKLGWLALSRPSSQFSNEME